MNRFIRVSFGILIGLFCLFNLACKKKKAFKNETGQTAVDLRMFQGQMDEAMADLNLAIMGQPLLRGKLLQTDETTLTDICGLEQDTSLVTQGIIRLLYTGIPCNGVQTIGEVKVTFLDYPLTKWKNAGANLKVDFIGYKCTWLTNGQSIQIDGSVNLKNESGKTWYDLMYLNEPKLVQVLSGNSVKLSFTSEIYTNISLNRRMEYTYTSSNKIFNCRVDGLGSQDGENQLENWGLTREGLKFTNRIENSVIWTTRCGAVAPIDGISRIKVEDQTHELQSSFAYDNQGNKIAGDNPCPYGWYVEWTYKKKTNSRLFSF